MIINLESVHLFFSHSFQLLSPTGLLVEEKAVMPSSHSLVQLLAHVSDGPDQRAAAASCSMM